MYLQSQLSAWSHSKFRPKAKNYCNKVQIQFKAVHYFIQIYSIYSNSTKILNWIGIHFASLDKFAHLSIGSWVCQGRSTIKLLLKMSQHILAKTVTHLFLLTYNNPQLCNGEDCALTLVNNNSAAQVFTQNTYIYLASWEGLRLSQ